MVNYNFTISEVFFRGHPLKQANDTFTMDELESLIDTSEYSENHIKEVMCIILVNRMMITEGLYRKYVTRDTEHYAKYILTGINVNEEWMTPTIRVLVEYTRRTSLYNDPKVIKTIQDEMLPLFVEAAREEFEYNDDAINVSFGRIHQILHIGNGWVKPTPELTL